MNNIFKAFGDISPGSVITVLEISKNVGKTYYCKKNLVGKKSHEIINTIILSILTLNTFKFSSKVHAYSSPIGAYNIVGGLNTNAFGYNNMAFDVNTSAFGHSNNTVGLNTSAFGHSNNTEGLNTSAFGYNNRASGENGVAFGNSNGAVGLNSSVFGIRSRTTAEGATAIGYNSLADEANTISVGQVGAEKRISHVDDAIKDTDAVNLKQLKTKADQGSVEILAHNLSQANVNITTLDRRISLNEDVIGSFKQGQESLVRLAVQYDSPTQDWIHLKGHDGTKLTNLQNAIVDVNSTDAVTGQQLYSTHQNLSLLSTQMIAASQQIVAIFGGGASFENGVFTGPQFNIQGVNHSNIGLTFNAVNSEITALKGSVNDLKAYVDSQDHTIALNAKNYTEDQSTGTFQNTKAYIDQQDAQYLVEAKAYTDRRAIQSLVDSKHYADQQSTRILDSAKNYTDQQISNNGQLISISGTASAAGTGINATGTGINATGQNSIAIGVNTVASGHNSTAIGVGNIVSGNNSGAFGDPNIVTGNRGYVIGNDNTVSGDNTFVVGNNVNTNVQNAVVLGNDSTADRDHTVSVGSERKQRQIINVASGTADTDAVNVAQVKQASTDTVRHANKYTDTKFSYLKSSLQDYQLQTEHRFNEVEKRFDRQGAMSAAMMNMALSTNGLKGQNRIALGAGLQGQESAVALGYQRVVNENTSLSISGALTRDETSGGVGVGFSW